MRRSEALQGVRVVKFRDIWGRYESSEFNQIEAAELLSVSERTFRRWCQRFEQGGESGLLDCRLGKASGKRVPSDRAEEVEGSRPRSCLNFKARLASSRAFSIVSVAHLAPITAATCFRLSSLMVLARMA